MAILDVVVLSVILVSMLVSVLRGFMYEAVMLLGWVLAFFIAKIFSPDFSQVFADVINNESWRMGLAFLLIFIAVLFANSIVAFLIKSIFSKSALRPMDRLLGSLFGLLRAAVILTVAALVIHILRLQDASWWVESKSAPVLNEVIVMARPQLRSLLNLDENSLTEKIQQINQLDNIRNAFDGSSETIQNNEQNTQATQTQEQSTPVTHNEMSQLLQNAAQRRQGQENPQ